MQFENGNIIIKQNYHDMFTGFTVNQFTVPVPVFTVDSLICLQYLQLIHAHHTTGPILVHCSAGIGRTGALITIDLALAQIERKGRVRVHNKLCILYLP